MKTEKNIYRRKKKNKEDEKNIMMCQGNTKGKKQEIREKNAI